MSRELRQRLLAFVTGVFRVPVEELYQLTFRVTRPELHENAHQQPTPLPESQSPALPLGSAGPPIVLLLTRRIQSGGPNMTHNYFDV